MARRLTHLTLDRVDSCPQGANPGAHIVLAKMGKPPKKEATVPDPKKDTKKKKDDDEEKDDEEPTVESLSAEIEKLTKANADQATTISALQKSAKTSATAKAKTAPKAAEAEDEEEDVEEDVEEDEEEDATITEKMMKAMPKTVQALLKKQNAFIAKAREEAKAAREEAAIEKAEREKAQFIKTAERDLNNLVGKADDKGALLYTLSKKLDAKEYKSVLELLKAGDKASKSLLMSEIGNDADMREDGSEGRIRKSEGARGDLEDKAEELRKADPKLSREQAFAKACDNNPLLYRKVRAEGSRARRVVDDSE